ncbi:hypothetical protein SLEP1_g41397 [Rubroshorea leprosula]|uniref:Uncharacterized protein n=1 Tax=Rubroshorea leprosula TaxID=152421 RepID=A0AAV5L6H4_9ROSI|nr:hypothetical protein SLEP1_g41397 [Rubroshorea leprosula]
MLWYVQERKRQLKSDLKKLETEKGRLKDQIIESLQVDNVLVNRLSETQSKELGELRSKLENLEKEFASTRTCGNSQSIARSGTSLIDFEQYCPNGDTEGSMQSSQATMLPPSSAFPSDATSPAIGSLSTQSLRTFGEGKARGRVEIKDCEGDLCSCNELKKCPWSMEEDVKLISYISSSGPGSWRELPKFAGLSRCEKCCRIRWMNHIIKICKP